jgi:hypothetical protein
MPGHGGDKKQVLTQRRRIEGQVRGMGLNRWKRPPTGTPSRLLKPAAAGERLVTGAIDSAVMRLARLGLIGAVLLVALHAFLFASGDGHHDGNPVPTTSMAEGSVQHDCARTALWSPVQAHDVADDCMPAIVGLGVLLLGMTGGQPRRPATVVLRSAAPVVAPPTPPPIVLGISRT